MSNPWPRPSEAFSLRCGFLFNHDQLHQIAHSAPIAFEFMRRSDGALGVDLLASTPAQYDRLREMLEEAGLPHDRLVLMRRPLWMRAAGRLLDPVLPFSRLISLLINGDLFRRLDLLVAPEKTSLVLRKLRGMEGCKFVHTRHGAGDREVGFNKQSSEFDLVLMSGPKIRDRLAAQGLLRENAHAIVGYPKFDLLDAATSRPRLFDNGRPTILYNPHGSPFLSSWFKDGEAVLVDLVELLAFAFRELAGFFRRQFLGPDGAVLPAVDERGEVARRPAFLVDALGFEDLLDEAQASARRLTGAADRYQYARAFTPPDEAVANWIDVDAAVLELKGALRDAERALANAAEAHGAAFIRLHLVEVRDRFGEPLRRVVERAGA